MDANRLPILDRLRARLLPAPSALVPKRSDFDLNPGARPLAPRALIASAVLVPVIARPEPTVLFTKRAAGLPHHPGQVSFPGGRAEDSDSSLTETALRETAEETGITADFITVAGYLDPYETITGFAVQPVVGVVELGFSLASDRREVAAIFEVPLGLLLTPGVLAEQNLEVKGTRRRVYGLYYGEEFIWGATAAMLVNLRERLV
jgi:NTP pyrophosphohydrolases including oxidative damage repair enzymes